MATLWTAIEPRHVDHADPAGVWTSRPLDGDTGLDDGFHLRAWRAGRRERWLLVAPAGGTDRAVVNGRPVAPVRLLADRDEVRLPSGPRLIIGLETAPRVEAFPGTVDATCPRCRSEIAEGAAAVCCPECHVWHHAGDDLPCWTYVDACAICTCPTDLDAGPRWTPEAL